MRLDNFDLNLLVALDAFLDERSVTRAGARMSLGQAAASAALRRLRDFFDDQLLVPVGRRFELTPLAQALIEPVKDTLVRARSTISIKPNFDVSKISRRFRICASDYVTYVLVSRVVREIAQRAPGFQLEIIHFSKRLEQVLDAGDIDLMILPEIHASKIPHPRKHLLSDEHVCLLCSQHPLAKRTMSRSDYFSYQHVNVRVGGQESVSFEELFLPKVGPQRKVACTIDFFCLLPQMLSGTDRIATLHEILARDLAHHFPVKVARLPFRIPKIDLSMVWPSFRDQDPSHKFLRDVFDSCAKSVMHSSHSLTPKRIRRGKKKSHSNSQTSSEV